MPPLPSGLPEAVSNGEDLARFLTQSSHFTQRKVHPSAFLPSPKDKTTSASRHGRQPIEHLIGLGRAATIGRLLYGAAIIKARDVREAGLDVCADEPPERHALIRHWPWIESDPQLEKAKQKECALRLASTAGLPLLFSP